jgi:hypothetical protein
MYIRHIRLATQSTPTPLVAARASVSTAERRRFTMAGG